jgi:phospholipase/carboxylesterase
MPELALSHLYAPPRHAAEKPPLLVLLHGVGSNERDLFGIAAEVDARFAVVSARAPHTRFAGSYAWFEVQMLPGATFVIDEAMWRESLAHVVDFIGEAVTAYDADPTRVYMLGFSQGAIMSLCVMLTRPDLVAGVVAMSGRLLPEVRPMVRPAADLEQFPVLITHGENDPVIPVRYGREVREFLEELPVDLAYHEFPMGHEVTGRSLKVAADWLTSQLG